MGVLKKITALCGLCMLATLLLHWILPHRVPVSLDTKHRLPNISRQLSISASSTGNKTILAWTTVFGKPLHIYKNFRPSVKPFQGCAYSNCVWSVNRSHLSEADAVIMHMFPGDFNTLDLPATRTANQLWVHLNLEAPIRFQDDSLTEVNHLFNLTATYEDDADISLPYGFYYKRMSPRHSYLPVLTNRNRSVVWMVSRCHTLSRREVYADKLKEHIDVDIFGKCGEPAPKKGSPPINLDFRTEMAKRYYFYLAFENADCVDYITEKFWSALLAGLVPIVRGQFPRYEKHAPPGSYINADAFFSYKELADYLHHLINTPSAYNKYFEWRRDYDVTTVSIFHNMNMHCKLCEILNTRPANTWSNHLQGYSIKERCFNYHQREELISEMEIAYDDELKNFPLPILKA